MFFTKGFITITPKEEDGNKKTCDVLDLMEAFGKYQLLQYVFICIPIIFVSMTSVNYIFTVGDVDYRYVEL